MPTRERRDEGEGRGSLPDRASRRGTVGTSRNRRPNTLSSVGRAADGEGDVEEGDAVGGEASGDGGAELVGTLDPHADGAGGRGGSEWLFLIAPPSGSSLHSRADGAILTLR